MFGGGRLICTFAGLMLIAAAVYAADDSRAGSKMSADSKPAASTASTSLAPPKAERRPIAEDFYGDQGG